MWHGKETRVLFYALEIAIKICTLFLAWAYKYTNTVVFLGIQKSQ
jgi:hypothetical protein